MPIDDRTSAQLGRRAFLGLAAGGTLLTAASALSPLAAFAGTPGSCNTLLHSDNFAQPASTGWVRSAFNATNHQLNGAAWSDATLFGNGRIAMVPDPLDPNGTVARFTVPNSGSDFRSELAVQKFGLFGKHRATVSIFIPSDWEPYEQGTIVTQWHGYPVNGDAINPPLALSIKGAPTPRWVFTMNRLVSGVVQRTRYDIATSVLLGQWNDFVFDIDWSTPTTSGLVVVTLNGVEVLRVAGDNNYHQSWEPYFKAGIYRSTWKPAHTYPTGGPDVVVLLKDIEIRDRTAC